ncbi:MAG: hypothetical protein QOE55_2213 [Acidobacteriaceae bacterium]|nr:hypothetical protein [Acidobacteriaceae bacterium]
MIYSISGLISRKIVSTRRIGWKHKSMRRVRFSLYAPGRTYSFGPDQPKRAILDLPNYSHYVIVYDPACDPLRIIRILHGARDIRRSLTTPR